MSEDKFQHTSHDLALVQDWLDARGYSGEAKTVMDTIDLIASLRAERDALRAAIEQAVEDLVTIELEQEIYAAQDVRMELAAALKGDGDD